MNSIIRKKKNKWFNQHIRKRYDRKAYTHSHCVIDDNNGNMITRQHRLTKIKDDKKASMQRQRDILKQTIEEYDYLLAFSFGCSPHNHIGPKPVSSSKRKTRDIHSIWYWFESDDITPKRIDLLDGNDKILYLISGYSPYELPSNIEERIREYSWNKDGEYSLNCIATTYWLAQRIDQYVNCEENKCPYSNNDDFNILQYIYVRGGALRDCYLFRQINDIDIVIDTHELSKKYVYHLMKYHLTMDKQKNCKCIYWRRYIKKFAFSRERIILHQQHDVMSILALKKYVIMSNFLLNAKFIVDIIYNEPNVDIESKYHGQHWLITIEPTECSPIQGDIVQFDLVDGTDNSQGIQDTFQEYGFIKELSEKQIVSRMTNIDKYNKSIEWMMDHPNNKRRNKGKRKWISVPIYPFPVNMRWYDLTINCGHIDLQSVLINSHHIDNRFIDYHWENKLIKKCKKSKHNEMDRGNMMAVKDMKSKIIRFPDLQILNKTTIQFYFWRFVKLTQKFIDKINVGIWKIDNKHLNRIKELYPLWFNENMTDKQIKEFVFKLLEWGINSQYDVLKRFKVFRYIGFEEHFKNILTKSLSVFLIEKINSNIDICEFGEIFKTCLHEFGYDDHWIRKDNGTIIGKQIPSLLSHRINHYNPLYLFNFVDIDKLLYHSLN